MNLSRHLRDSVCTCILLTILFLSSCSTGLSSSSSQSKIKYVFYFIGDGMGSTQIHVTEAYLASLADGYKDSVTDIEKTKNLSFSDFPALGMATTYCANRFITDSGAAGTALACGKKTLLEVISMDTDKKTPLTTIAELAKTKGMKVGIVTSIGIDYATPPVFYAHTDNRYNYYDIGLQLANSDFDYFAGGSLHEPVQRTRVRNEDGSVETVESENTYDLIKENGFKIAASRQELNNCKPGERVFAYNKAEENKNALYFEIDRPDDCMSLAEFTEKGIGLLENNKGFFMMVEGGQIDSACHNNDAMAAIYETIAFEGAINKALDFYKKYPDETLIVVTSDHETGGMSIGYGTSYETAFELLKNQKMSQIKFVDTVLSKYSPDQWNGIEDNIPDSLKTDVKEAFGIEYDRLNPYEKDLLEKAYDKHMSNKKRMRIIVNEFRVLDDLLYSDKNPFGVTLTRIFDNRAGIGWTGLAHTGIPVEVHAIGTGSELFRGFYDNTDIPKKMAKLMAVKLDN